VIPAAYFQQTSISTISTILVTGTAAALAASSPNGEVLRAEVALGEVAFDDCSCGLVALTVPRVYVSRPGFPLDGTLVAQNCDTGYVVAQVNITVARCFPGPDENGNPPTSDVISTASVNLYQDAAIVWNYLSCQLGAWTRANPQRYVAQYILQEQVPLGPGGSCAAIETHLLLGWLRDCGC
jgi:hypothetical protein